MPTALTDLLSQAALLLDDVNGRTWSSETLTGCFRLTLDEYNRACGLTCTLAGLDGASETTLPVRDASLLVRGACGTAVLRRTLQRAESANLGQQVPAELRAWGEARLAEFHRGLEAVRLANLHGGAAPWGAWTWDENHEELTAPTV